MITSLPDRIATLPERLRLACEQIFRIDVVTGRAVPPAPMEEWIGRQFGDVAAVREQTIVKVTNRLTLESALFNPLRARRPSQPGGGEAALEAWIARELAHDIFGDPLCDTTADMFGRIRGQFCVTASNVAKYEGWHGLVIFDEPHPLRFGRAQLADYLDVALRWIAEVHIHDRQAIYPIVTWNCLPKSGATLMHGHMQMAVARDMHYARVEGWRRAAEVYRARAGTSYIDDLCAIHRALGLEIRREDGQQAFVHLTPVRNREMVLLAGGSAPAQGAFCGPAFADPLYDILRGLIDGQGVRAFNLAIALPPLGPTTEDWRDMPIIVRLADRGDPLTTRGDLGAMELFASGCIVADPFDVAARLRVRASDPP